MPGCRKGLNCVSLFTTGLGAYVYSTIVGFFSAHVDAPSLICLNILIGAWQACPDCMPWTRVAFALEDSRLVALDMRCSPFQCALYGAWMRVRLVCKKALGGTGRTSMYHEPRLPVNYTRAKQHQIRACTKSTLQLRRCCAGLERDARLILPIVCFAPHMGGESPIVTVSSPQRSSRNECCNELKSKGMGQENGPAHRYLRATRA